MNLLKSLAVIGKTAKKCAPTILSVAGAAGVAVTGVAAAKAGYEDAKNDIEQNGKTTPEAGEEKIKRKIKTYAKPILFGAASVGCILAGDRLHAKRYMALGAAAGIIQERYDRLQEYLKTCNGYTEIGDKRVNYTEPGQLEGVTRAKANASTAEDIFKYCREHSIEPEDTHTGENLWYEPISKTYFLASEAHVERAFSLANRLFKAKGEVTMSDVLRYLELSAANKPGYDLLHWNEYEGETFYGYDWIDVTYLKKELYDGPEYTQIFYLFDPHLGEK